MDITDSVYKAFCANPSILFHKCTAINFMFIFNLLSLRCRAGGHIHSRLFGSFLLCAETDK